jgi:hypothetical protein
MEGRYFCERRHITHLALILLFHLRLQVSERIIGCRRYFCVLGAAIAYEVLKLGVFLVVAINTQ